uniref:Uncharacterized protein n=1 Tax=Arundo donax TaxID=35708 RepID=A0A0A8Y6G1_ARUDO
MQGPLWPYDIRFSHSGLGAEEIGRKLWFGALICLFAEMCCIVLPFFGFL